MTEYVGTLRWFGRSFDTPMYEGMPEVPTPVGSDCSMCREPILEGEAGVTMPHGMSVGWQTLPQHIECHLRSVLGGPDHLDGKCYCVTGKHAETDLTYREEARIVVERYWGPRWMEGP